MYSSSYSLIPPDTVYTFTLFSSTGRFSTNTSDTCTACAPGTSSNFMRDRCVPCAVGMAGAGGEGVACSSCEPGTFTSTRGSASCTACPGGKTSNHSATYCVSS